MPQVPGQYQVQSIGTGVGDYTVFAMSVDEFSIRPQLKGYITGTIAISEMVGFSFEVPSLVHLPIILK